MSENFLVEGIKGLCGNEVYSHYIRGQYLYRREHCQRHTYVKNLSDARADYGDRDADDAS